MSTNARQTPVSFSMQEHSVQKKLEPETLAQEDVWWNALCRRDKQADGRFVYGVKTTGIFCMPSCASRLPLRENVQFFADAEAAKQAGFRPCKRCRPGNLSREERQCAAIEHACQLIAQAETPLTLVQVANAVGISPYHFHRLFKAQVGVTPKRYAAALRAQRVRQSLSNDAPVTQAALAAGFHSSGQFYHESDLLLGMSPRSFKNKGQDMTIHFAVGQCSLGEILVAESERGVCAVLLGDDATALINELQSLFANATLVGGDTAFEQRMALVVSVIDSPGVPMTLPLDIRGTAFQLRVWEALREIPLGATLSYRDVAERIGQPDAVRAVAGACAANRLAVLIPCHRVIRTDGALSGYRWGIARKRQLLESEAKESHD